MVVAHIEQNEIEIKISAPDSLRADPVDRASRALLEHMISILGGAGPDFPLEQWNLLMPQIIITLSLLRESRCQPLLSACAQAKGVPGFNKAPLAPLGCAATARERAGKRGSWAGF